MGSKEVARGKGAEDRIATVLSSITGLDFVRTPGSGSSNAWKYFKRLGTKIRGDIVCVTEGHVFGWLLESKKSKTFKLDLLFKVPIDADFVRDWAKTITDAELDGKFPMLVRSRDQGPMIVICFLKDWEQAGLNVHQAVGRFSYKGRWLVLTTVQLFATAYKSHMEGK